PTKSTILDALKAILEPTGDLGLRDGTTDVDELWLQDSIAILCGGDLELLLDAVEAAPSDEWELLKDNNNNNPLGFLPSWREKKWAWQVRWKGFVKPPTPEPSESEKEYDESENYWRSSLDVWRGWADDALRDEDLGNDGEAEVQSSPPTTPSPEDEAKGGEAVSSGWGAAPADDWGLVESWNNSGWLTEEPSWT
ncbi:hypothetical protein M407DRAFT_16634, partial [Tulasnella calospora MUT 4182]